MHRGIGDALQVPTRGVVRREARRLVLVSFLWQHPPESMGEARAKKLLALVFRGLGASL